MANRETAAPVTIQEPLVSSLAQTDALAKLLIEKGILTRPCGASDIQSAAQYHSMLFANTAEPSGNVVETQTHKCSQSSSNNQSGKSAKESHPT